MISIADISLYSYLGSKWTAIIVGLLVALFVYKRKVEDYFPSRGVKTLPFSVPFIGHMFKVFIQKEHMSTLAKRFYYAFPDEKYVGMHQFTKPIVMITDLDIIKQIAIKDFDSFQDHISVIDEKMDPLFGNNLVLLNGQKMACPAFTSSKMKGMFGFVAECGEEMISYFEEELKKPENNTKGHLEIEFKDTFARYTNDVIATSAFGIKINSLKDRENEFYTMGKESNNFKGIVMLKFFLMMVFPSIMKMLRVRILSEKCSAFFRNLVSTAMKTREDQHIIRSDMIQLLMEAKKGSLKHETKKEEGVIETGFATVQESAMGKQLVKREWTDDEIIAQAIIFFFAGFETTSNLLGFAAHELAINPDIQKRLQEEVDEVSAKCGGKVNYTDLHAMKYMDMTYSVHSYDLTKKYRRQDTNIDFLKCYVQLNETLRYWPPGAAMDRKCVKKYTLPPSNVSSKEGITLNVGDGVWIPLHEIHRDPKYYENPDTFDPERFSDENKGSINPLTYMAFGVGPRNCIGSRFALMECKAIIFQILQKFNLVPIAKTSHPMKIVLSSFNFIPENGFWIGVKPRDIK